MLLDLLKPENIGFVNSCRLSKDKIYQINPKKKTGKSLHFSKKNGSICLGKTEHVSIIGRADKTDNRL